MKILTYAALIPAVIGTFGCARPQAAAPVQPKPVTLGVVTTVQTPTVTEYSALLAPDAETELAFRVPGYVTEILQTTGPDGRARNVEAGAAVASGTVLAKIRPTGYQAVVDRARGSYQEAIAGIDAARSQLVQAEAAENQAELDFTRIAALWQQESITKPAYDGSLAKRDAARAAVAGAKAGIVAAEKRAASVHAQVQEAEIALGDTVLRAPYAATLLERRVERGTLVASGVPVFSLADLRQMRAKFNVPDTALTTIRAGQAIPVTLTALPGESIEGRVLAIARSADPRARSFEVQVLVSNPANRLRSGMIASVRLQEAALAAHTQVPAAAVVHDPVSGRDQIFLAVSEGARLLARKRNVTVTPASGGQALVTEGGLLATDRIVVNGTLTLQDGDLIQEAK